MILNKVLTSVALPLRATVGLVRAGMAACQCSTIGGDIVTAADMVASEWLPPAVQASGKCFVSLRLYCWGAYTANPYAIAAGTQVLTSIVTDQQLYYKFVSQQQLGIRNKDCGQIWLVELQKYQQVIIRKTPQMYP